MIRLTNHEHEEVQYLTQHISDANGGIGAISHLLSEIIDVGSDLNRNGKTEFSSPFYLSAFIRSVKLLSDSIAEHEGRLSEILTEAEEVRQ